MEKNKTNIGCMICEDIFKTNSKFYYNPDITADWLDYLIMNPSKRLY